MCLMTYVASDVPLDSARWRQGQGVMICNLPDTVSAVAKQFTLPHVYMVASTEGCACGFLTLGKNEEEFNQAIRERHALGDLLQQCMAKGATLELLICYAGDEEKAVTQRLESMASALPSIPFDQGWDYEVLLVNIVQAIEV